MRTVVTGLIGQFPFGGVVWDYVQYVLGFRALGHDVYYLEDSGSWPYDPVNKTVSEDCSYNVRFLQSVFGEFGIGDRWIYRNAADGSFHGAGEAVARELLREADLLVNVSTAGWFEDMEVSVKHRMLIDGDPMFTQITLLEEPDSAYSARLREHDSHFTFGLKIGDPDCKVPETGIVWKPTLQPVALDQWPEAPDGHNGEFSTIMNWCSYAPKSWQGRIYGQKDLEFEKYIDLPRHTDQPFTLAMGQGLGLKRPDKLLAEMGWKILEPQEVTPDHHSYRSFIRDSKAEWSIAKQAYVSAHTGWFSCRSACYLAAGRPVVVQDTGWSEKLPHGAGLLPFSNTAECVEAIKQVNLDYAAHRKAAREFAHEYLDAQKVCRKLLEDAGIGLA